MRRWIVGLTWLVALVAAAGALGASDPPGLALSARQAGGYVDVTISGPAGQSVALSERRGGDDVALATVVLGPDGRALVRHAISWLCAPLTRLLVASTPAGAQATLSVETPACTHRLAVRLPHGAPVGRSVSVAVRDRWGTGGLPLTVCEQPPGGRMSCRSQTLAPGHPRGAVALDLPRPGGYAITVYGRDGARHRQIIWAEHPGGRLTLLAAGDSEMQVLDDDLAADLAPYRVSVTDDARPSTGLTVPRDLNWQQEARRQAGRLHPDVTVVSMGANEGYAVPGPSGTPIDCCGAAWSAGYGRLVFRMAHTLLQNQLGRVYWFVLPTPKPPEFRRVLDAVNAGIELAAARLPGRMGLLDANAFFTPGDRYRDQMTYAGQRFTIHEPDGIHLDASADAVAARLTVQRLLADRVIRPLR